MGILLGLVDSWRGQLGSLLLLLFLEPLVSLLNHLISQPLLPQKDPLLRLRHLLQILALEKDSGNGDQLLLLLHLFELLFLLLLFLRLAITHYDVINTNPQL